MDKKELNKTEVNEKDIELQVDKPMESDNTKKNAKPAFWKGLVAITLIMAIGYGIGFTVMSLISIF
jgi:hypothetical protein